METPLGSQSLAVSRASRAARLAVSCAVFAASDHAAPAGGIRLKPSTHAWLADRHARNAAAAASDVIASGGSVAEILAASIFAREAAAAAAMAAAASRVSRIKGLLDELESI